MTKIIELTNKNFKTCIVNLLKNVKEIINIMKEKNGRYKKDPKEILEIKKSTILEIKNAVDRMNRILVLRR